MKAPLALVLFALLAPPAVAEFGPESADGFPVNVLGETVYPPVAPIFMDSPLNRLGPATVYPYYPLLTAEVQRLARDHPDLVKLTSAGKSTLGLDLWMLEIADFARIEAGEGLPLEGREVVYLDGGTHSNEYSPVYFVVAVAQFLTEEYGSNETATWILENRRTFIVPLVNPDGSNAFGRLNAKTVNVNRNFPGTWGTVDEDPLFNNPGPSPGSEVETQVVMRLFDELRPDYAASIHCCGNLWLHPWGAEDLASPEDMQMFTRVCDEAFGDVRDSCGEIWSTIYPAGGNTADEAYLRVGASGWGYEMSGRGRVAPWGQPVTFEDVQVQERESWAGVMHAFLNVHRYGARPHVVSVDGDGDVLRVVVENVGYGNLTHGNLTVGSATVALPRIDAGERATVEVPGSFAAGEVPLALDFAKRARTAPQGLVALPVALVREGGGLRGVLPEGPDAPLEAAAADAAVPGPAIGLAAFAVAAAALALRRRS